MDAEECVLEMVGMVVVVVVVQLEVSACLWLLHKTEGVRAVSLSKLTTIQWSPYTYKRSTDQGLVALISKEQFLDTPICKIKKLGKKILKNLSKIFFSFFARVCFKKMGKQKNFFWSNWYFWKFDIVSKIS